MPASCRALAAAPSPASQYPASQLALLSSQLSGLQPGLWGGLEKSAEALESLGSSVLESLESLALESLESLALVRELLLLELVLEGSVQISAHFDTAEAFGLCTGVIDVSGQSPVQGAGFAAQSPAERSIEGALQRLLLVLEGAAQAPARLCIVATLQLLRSAQASIPKGALQLLLVVLVGCASQLLLLTLEGTA